MYVTIDATTRVPARTAIDSRIGIDSQRIAAAIVQQSGDVTLETAVTIFGTAYLHAVEPYISIVHQTFEVNQHLLATPCFGGIKSLAEPTGCLFLESTCAAGRLYPGLVELIVVGQVEAFPVGIVKGRGLAANDFSQMEAPAEVEQFILSFLSF